MTSDHGSRKLPWFTLAVTFSIISIYAFFGPAPDALVWDRDLIRDGQTWRLISGHFAHADFEHLAWNAGALIILGSLLEISLTYGIRKMILANIISAILIHGMIYTTRPDLIWYVGFSGILNSYFIIALYGIWQKTRSPVAIFVGFGAIAKTCAEVLGGGSVLGIGSWQAVPQAHMAGLISGVIMVFLAALCERDTRPKKSITTF